MPTAVLEHGIDRKAKARQLVAYLSYAMQDVSKLSTTSAHLLEMSVAALSEESGLPAEDEPKWARQRS
jgi:hypothetical protein